MGLDFVVLTVYEGKIAGLEVDDPHNDDNEEEHGKNNFDK